MSRFEIKLPKMGESVAEATITSWLKNVGDSVELDEAIVEIATDKVDSEVPSEVEGILIEKLFEVDEVVKVGGTIAVIETLEDTIVDTDIKFIRKEEEVSAETIEKEINEAVEKKVLSNVSDSEKFFSPLVKNIAVTEGISMAELETIVGTGRDERVTKNDILAYIESGRESVQPVIEEQNMQFQPKELGQKVIRKEVKKTTVPISVNGDDEIIEMSRMGKLVAQHMVASVQTSAHVQSFIEVDVTNIVNWRNKVKEAFLNREGENMTYTPIFMQSVAKAIKQFPMINIAVEDDKIIKRKAINLGMAAALADGNLIVPVIKNADQLNLVGMVKAVNDLANKARNGKLNPDDIQGGTYTVTNVGGFGSVFGTPIINQPQVAILALGAVRKVPAVIETPEGDFIGIRHKMFLSHSYDHRVVNGALGGMFIKAIKEDLEAWDINKKY